MQHIWETGEVLTGFWCENFGGRDHFKYRGARWEDNIKMDPKEIQWDSINWINLAGSTEQDNEPSGSTKCRVFSD
jgi:hypothetical protein